MYRSIRGLGLFTLLSLGISLGAQAALVAPTNSIDGLNLNWSKSESNTLQAFDENQNISIKSDSINVDYLMGENLNVGQSFTGVNRSNSGLYLKEGTYSSQLLHFDPLGTKRGQIQNARFEFTDSIVAIILGGEYLRLSDYLLGNANTLYDTSSSRRMETNDFFTLESSNTLLVDKVSVGRYWTDDVRIITQKVSEPSSWAIFGLGLLGLVGARKIAKQ
tara:strand:+ start:17266 stop:17922 length:657 start_codon:yes stop_codon:yes gene_type:complete